MACEYSATVRDAFLAQGFDAWSVDLAPTEGDSSRHIQGDALVAVFEGGWDLMIAFPPCDHLSKAGARWWPAKQADGRQNAAATFFQALWEAPVPRIAIENPVGWMNTNWRKPDQIIHPWQHGHPWKKETCLWLKGLPLLQPTKIVEPQGFWVGGDARKPGLHRNPKERARTFAGIAGAMALQWL